MRLILFTILFTFKLLGAEPDTFLFSDKEIERIETSPSLDKSGTLLDFFKNHKLAVKEELKSEKEFLQWFGEKHGKKQDEIDLNIKNIDKLVVEKDAANKVAVSRLRLSKGYDVVLMFAIMPTGEGQKYELSLGGAFLIPHQEDNIGMFFGNGSEWGDIKINPNVSK